MATKIKGFAGLGSAVKEGQLKVRDDEQTEEIIKSKKVTEEIKNEGGKYELKEWEDQGEKQMEKEMMRKDILKYFEGVNDLLSVLRAEVNYFKDAEKEKDEYSQRAEEIFDYFENKFEELSGDFEYVKIHLDELRNLYFGISDSVVKFRRLRGGESHEDFEKYLSGEKRPKKEFISNEERKEIELIEEASKVTLEKLSENQKEEIVFKNEKGEITPEFKYATRKLWTEFAVHGMLGVNAETGVVEVKHNTDIDGESAMKILKLAGLNISNVEYVAPGKISKGKINIDTGGEDGLLIIRDEEGNMETVIIDHHSENSERDTSATEWVYKTMTGLGMLKREDYLDRVVDFVNQEDNYDFRDAESYFESYFKNGWKTMMGLRRAANWNNLVKFFKYQDPDSGGYLSLNTELDDNMLRYLGFIFKTVNKNGNEKIINKSEQMKGKIEKAKRKIEKMEQNGFIFDTKKYGKVAINLEGNLGAVFGDDALRASGCETRIGWSPNVERFSFSSLVGKDIEDEFSQGLNIRGSMWVKPPGPIHMSLGEVIRKIAGEDFEPQGELAKYLEKEKNERELNNEDESNLDKYYLDDLEKMMNVIETIDYDGDDIEEQKRLGREYVIDKFKDDLIIQGAIEPRKMENAINYLRNKINI